MTEVARDWTPVLRGGIYCSPACGGRCTKAAYDRAASEDREDGMKDELREFVEAWRNRS